MRSSLTQDTVSVEYKLVYKPFGAHSILIEWPSKIDVAILDNIICFKRIIVKEFKDVEAISAYHSLTIVFKNEIDFSVLEKKLKTLYNSVKKGASFPKKIWHLPVCYSEEYGLDIKEYTKVKGFSLTKLIQLHTTPLYTVFCIGFLPGFMYLGGLDTELYHPRRSTPRLKIPKGSVGIGGEQTGIYPQASPGGWNIIGNSPIKLFDPHNRNPCRISVGDKVKFYDVSEAEYELLSIQVETEIYNMESEVIHD